MYFIYLYLINYLLSRIDTFLDGFSLDGEELPVNNKSDNGDTLKSFDDFKGNIQNELSVSENLVSIIVQINK